MVSCGKCGAPALPDSAFCRSCGEPLAVSTSGAAPLAIFVGPNQARYLAKWATCDRRGTSYSWNWSAFLFGLFWMAYRKMYVNAGILLGIACLESIATYEFHLAEPATNAMNFALAIVIGLQGNHWYRNHAEKQIAGITATVPADQLRATLERQGGTNPLAAMIALVALLAIIALLYAVSGPPPGDTIST